MRTRSNLIGKTTNVVKKNLSSNFDERKDLTAQYDKLMNCTNKNKDFILTQGKKSSKTPKYLTTSNAKRIVNSLYLKGLKANQFSD